MIGETARDHQTRRAFFDRGSTLLSSVFRTEKSSAVIAAAANALSEISLRQDAPDMVRAPVWEFHLPNSQITLCRLLNSQNVQFSLLIL